MQSLRSGGSSTDLKALIDLVSDTKGFKEHISELDKKTREAGEAFAALRAKQDALNELEAALKTKEAKLQAQEEALLSKAKALEEAQQDFGKKQGAIVVKEKEFLEAKAKFEASYSKLSDELHDREIQVDQKLFEAEALNTSAQALKKAFEEKAAKLAALIGG